MNTVAGKSKSRRVALYGIWSALFVVVLSIETLVFVFFGYTPPAFLSLSVVFTLCFLSDYRIGFFSGLLFGLTSLMLAVFTSNPLFIKPWISVLPRLFVGIGAYATFILTKKFTLNSENNFVKNVLPYSVGAFFGVLINTSLVIIALTIFPTGLGSLSDVIKACISINFPIELLVSVILTPILSKVAARYSSSF